MLESAAVLGNNGYLLNSFGITMINADKVFLIGPMAAGKSSIGRQLADTLHLPFYDSDQVIEARCGADIAWIFDIEGEEGFRKRESSIIDELTKESKIVLATGGGAILRSFNQNCLTERGTVIYLEASLDTLIQRTEKDRRRPLLQNTNKVKVLGDLLKKRVPIYESLADITVNTDSQNMKQTVKDILKGIKS